MNTCLPKQCFSEPFLLMHTAKKECNRTNNIHENINATCSPCTLQSTSLARKPSYFCLFQCQESERLRWQSGASRSLGLSFVMMAAIKLYMGKMEISTDKYNSIKQCLLGSLETIILTICYDRTGCYLHLTSGMSSFREFTFSAPFDKVIQFSVCYPWWIK